MSEKVLVTGATGQQGGLVARELLKLGYAVRAFVRDQSSDPAKRLEDLGADLVQGDYDDPASIDRAFAGVDSVFIVGTPYAGAEKETEQGIALVDAAVRADVGHIVYSSVAGAAENTGIEHFESKYVVEQHLRSVSNGWTIVAPVFFMENFAFPWNTADLANGFLRQGFSPTTSLQMISSVDIGRFIAQVIKRGPELVGRRIEIAGDALTGAAIAERLGSKIGRSIEFQVQPLEELKAQSEDMANMYEWFQQGGFSVDIDQLHREFSEVKWTSFADWTERQDWAELLRSNPIAANS